MDVNSGLTSPRVNKGVPHSGQKVRAVRPPLLPRTGYVLGVPLTRRSAVMTTTPDAKGAPLERWQSLQWQLRAAMGALPHSYRIEPHAQPPENGGVMSQSIVQASCWS